jgi:hypothetical protein
MMVVRIEDELTATPEFPDGDCPDGLRASIYFPHCW